MRTLYPGKFLRVEAWSTPSGEREVVVHPGAVALLVTDEQGRVLLVRQPRAAAQGEVWEIPAGTMEPGEAPLETAQRELREETGVVAERCEYVGTFWTTPGYSSERLHLFRVRRASGTPRAQSEVEEVRFFPLEEVLSLARQGRGDGKTLAALAFLFAERAS